MRPFLLTLFVLVVAHRASAIPPPSSGEAERLIRQLGSPSFQEREAASKRLVHDAPNPGSDAAGRTV
jgi:hypothetical protein